MNSALQAKVNDYGEDMTWLHKKHIVKNRRRPWEKRVRDYAAATVSTGLDGDGSWGPPYTRPIALDLNATRAAGAALPVDPIVCAAVGKGHAIVSTAAGKMFTWGELNDSGQLGLAQSEGRATGRFAPSQTPVLNPTLSVHPYSIRTIASVSAGTAHTAAVTDEGIAYTWGCAAVPVTRMSHCRGASDCVCCSPVLRWQVQRAWALGSGRCKRSPPRCG